MKYCKNCGHPVYDLYCGHCGQKISPGKISFAFLCGELFHFVTHMESGFLFTSFQMIAHPGRTAKNYIEGNRKKYQSPISYFLIWTTIFILFLYLVDKIFGYDKVINYGDYFGPAGDTRVAISNLSLVLTVIVPFQALYLFMLVTRKSYNYFETMVATIYSIGTIILFQFLFALLVLISQIIHPGPVNLLFSDSFKILYLIWFISDTIRLYPVKHKYFRTITFMALAFGTFTFWRLYGLPVAMKFIL